MDPNNPVLITDFGWIVILPLALTLGSILGWLLYRWMNTWQKGFPKPWSNGDMTWAILSFGGMASFMPGLILAAVISIIWQPIGLIEAVLLGPALCMPLVYGYGRGQRKLAIRLWA